MERCQWLVKKSRELGVLNCGNVTTGHEGDWDVDDFERETRLGYGTVWSGQIAAMVEDAKHAWRRKLSLTVVSGQLHEAEVGNLR